MKLHNLPHRMSDVRGLIGLTQTALAKRLGVSPSLVSMWESGERSPAETQVLEIARGLGVSLDFLINAEVRPHFQPRAMVTMPANEDYACRAALLDATEQVFYLASAYEMAKEVPGQFGLRCDFSTGQLPGLVQQVREAFKLDRRVSSEELKRAATERNIHVFEWSLPSKISGLSYRGALTVIIINHDHPPGRRLFTLAHELGHVLFHLPRGSEGARGLDTEVSFFASNRDPKEKEANSFAAELLMPTDEIDTFVRRFKVELQSPTFLPVAARTFNVSPDALFYRLVGKNAYFWPDKDRFLSNRKPEANLPDTRVENVDEQVDAELVRLGLRLHAQNAISAGKVAEWFFAPRLVVEDYLARFAEERDSVIVGSGD